MIMEQVEDIGDSLWIYGPRAYRDRLGDEITSLTTESTDILALCKKTGIRLTLRTLGPDSWDLVVT